MRPVVHPCRQASSRAASFLIDIRAIEVLERNVVKGVVGASVKPPGELLGMEGAILEEGHRWWR